jgi:hypothetical protein
MKWRIYRLPGDKEWWRIDHGPGSLILWAKDWISFKPTRSVENNGELQPRAWIEVESGKLYVAQAQGKNFPRAGQFEKFPAAVFFDDSVTCETAPPVKPKARK